MLKKAVIYVGFVTNLAPV